jgi:hypothetical protein
MKNNIQPKLENANVGFHYTVTEEQLKEYATWTIEEKLNWLYQTNEFLFHTQTKEEKERMRTLKNNMLMR